MLMDPYLVLELQSTRENSFHRPLTHTRANLKMTGSSPGFPRAVAASFLLRGKLLTVDVQDNAWERPPAEFVEIGFEAIVRYFDTIERSGFVESWMLKVVLVGAVCAGKSSVVESLMARKPQSVERRTRGVDVHVDEPFKPDVSKPVELVFWDFAGHHDYHSTHSLFLSRDALFLLVVDLARFEEDPSCRSDSIYIWLDTLLCRTPGAVVQIVATHTDDERVRDQENAVKRLRQAVFDHLKLGQEEGKLSDQPTLKVIHEIHAVSCTSGTNWRAFGEAMADLATEGTRELLLGPSSKTSQTTAQKEREGKMKLFSLGKQFPKTHERAGAAMDALRDGRDPHHAATLPPQSASWKDSNVHRRFRYLYWEAAEREWKNIVDVSSFSDEVAPGEATAILQVLKCGACAVDMGVSRLGRKFGPKAGLYGCIQEIAALEAYYVITVLCNNWLENNWLEKSFPSRTGMLC